MRKLLFLLGDVLVVVSIFAVQFGLDNDAGWGRGRLLGLAGGMALILFSTALPYITKGISRIRIDIQNSTQIALTTIIVSTSLLGIYLWLIQLPLRDTQGNYGYYAEIARAFKAGHLYLNEEPSAELLALDNPCDYFERREKGIENFPWDVSLYQGKLYAYWGPVPAFLLFPFNDEQLTHIGDHYLVLVLGFGTFLFSALLLLDFWRDTLKYSHAWLLGISLLVVGLAAPVTVMFKDARVYEAAIFGGQFFFLGGCYWVISALRRESLEVWRLALAASHWGLALGARITVLPMIAFALLLTVGLALYTYKTSHPKTVLLVLAALGLPLALAGAGLAWYNWARFGEIAEFGMKYQLTNVDYKVFTNSFSIEYIPQNIYNYFVYPLEWKQKFPYIARVELTSSNERLAGFLRLSPYIFLLFMPPLVWLTAPKDTLPVQRGRIAAFFPPALFAGAAAISMTVILSFYFVTMRYMEDFMPSLLLCIAMLVGLAYQKQRPVWKTVTAGVILLPALLTILANLLVAMPRPSILFVINVLHSLGKLLGMRLQ